MAVVASLYMFSLAFDLGERLPTGGPPFSDRPRIFLAFRRGRSALGPACCRRSQSQQVSGWERRGQLSREGQLLRREVGFNYVVRSYVLPGSLTWPTRLPRHAACVSSQQSKPVRPRFWEEARMHPYGLICNGSLGRWCRPSAQDAADYERAGQGGPARSAGAVAALVRRVDRPHAHPACRGITASLRKPRCQSWPR